MTKRKEKKLRKRILLFLVLAVFTSFLVRFVQGSSGEIDATAIVSYVIDGDTFDTTSGDRIRLADIDAPDLGEYQYSEARSFLTSLVDQKTVYLDVDDVYRTDQYGRLVCVVYVDYNSTHLLNVNRALLVEGYAVIWNFDNEFNPYAWTLHVPISVVPEFPSFTILPIFMGATLAALAVSRKIRSD